MLVSSVQCARVLDDQCSCTKTVSTRVLDGQCTYTRWPVHIYQMASAHILDGQCSCIRRPVLVYLWGFKNGGQIDLNFTASKLPSPKNQWSFVRGDSMLKGRVAIMGVSPWWTLLIFFVPFDWDTCIIWKLETSVKLIFSHVRFCIIALQGVQRVFRHLLFFKSVFLYILLMMSVMVHPHLPQISRPQDTCVSQEHTGSKTDSRTRKHVKFDAGVTGPNLHDLMLKISLNFQANIQTASSTFISWIFFF